MADETIADLSLADAARALAAKKFSSVEATEACLARLERFAPRLNCVAALDRDDALKQARAADAEIAKGKAKPLLGVPLAHKDMYYRKGRISGCGSKIRADFVPDQTAFALQKLDAAGALDIARLAMVEFALGVTGHNPLMGTPRNPWNPDYVTGGSSSGSGVAVSGRMVYAALGSDTGGSIRFPASCCGLVGLKATYGRVSRRGAMGLSASMDTVGALTRTVEDAALMLQVIAGHDPEDATTSRRPVPDYMADIEKGAKGLRVGVPDSYFHDTVDPEVRGLVEKSLDALKAAGATVIEVPIPDISAANPLTTMITATEGASLHERWLKDRTADYGPQTLGRLLAGLFVPGSLYVDALRLRKKMVREFVATVFDSCDVLHVPMMTVPVPTIAESDTAANPGFGKFIVAMGHCSRPFNWLGLPVASMPCGFTKNGLPTAFQLAARPFAEATILRALRAYERETPWTSTAPDMKKISG